MKPHWLDRRWVILLVLISQLPNLDGLQRTAKIHDVNYRRRVSIGDEPFGPSQLHQYMEKHWLTQPVQRLEQLLKDEWRQNSKLENAFNKAIDDKPDFKQDWPKLAAFVYTYDEPERYVYEEFNNATAFYQDSDKPEQDYNFKALYSLLYLLELDVEGTVYRFSHFPEEVHVGQYIRFNHFVSTSVVRNEALKFINISWAERPVLFTIANAQCSNIVDYSYLADEDECLIRPDVQFRVTSLDVSHEPVVNGYRKVQQIELTVAKSSRDEL